MRGISVGRKSRLVVFELSRNWWMKLVGARSEFVFINKHDMTSLPADTRVDETFTNTSLAVVKFPALDLCLFLVDVSFYSMSLVRLFRQC